MKPQYLTPEELVRRFRGTVSLQGLANWRSDGIGPNPTKIGGRVLYLLTEVERWEKRRTRVARRSRS
jgi:hypothetical protein